MKTKVGSMFEELSRTQAKLDDRIIEEKNINTEDRTYSHCMDIALMTEVFELVNELRSFKLGSNDRNIRVEKAREELVDVLHFLLNKYNEEPTYFNLDKEGEPREFKHQDPYEECIWVTQELIDTTCKGFSVSKLNSVRLVHRLLDVAHLLGMTLDDIKEEYLKKNATNHVRQNNGY